MAKSSTGSWATGNYVPARPKKTRQGRSQNTNFSASSRNNAKKRYRGQGK